MRLIYKKAFQSITFFSFALLFSSIVNAQTWSFRAGFGQAGATNSLADIGRAICSDAAGNVYVTGKISDDLTGNTVSFGGTPLVSAGDDDGFVAKFNAAGVHQWSLRFGGTAFIDIGNAIATDGTSVYVAGAASGAMTVGTSGTSYPAAVAGIDGVIMKLDAATGAVNWVTRFGGINADEAQAICFDGSGNVYVSGIFRTRTANATATFGAFTRTVQGNTTGFTSDMFVAKLNSSGVFQWVSTGGIAGSNDNILGSGICYVPSLDEVIVTGSLRSTAGGSTAATYTSVSPASTINLTHSSAAVVNEDFYLLEVNAGNGQLLSGSGVGAGGGNEAGLGITYDPFTGDVFFTGYFSSTSVTFPGLPAITNGANRDNIIYGRYNPATDAYIWVRDADNSASASAADVGRAISSTGTGSVLISGNFRNTVTFPPGVNLVASGTMADLFVARVNVVNGNVDYVKQGTGNSTTVDDIAYGVTGSTNGNIWITGQYSTSLTLAPLGALASVGNKEDILLARYDDAPVISTHPASVTGCSGSPATFTVAASGSGTLTYAWQEATNSTFTAGLVTLGTTGVYSGTNTATLSISDVTGLNGRFYRAVVSNANGSVNSLGASLTVQAPTLSAGGTVTQAVNTNGNTYFGAGCALIAKVVPSGANPVTGSVTSQVWVEPTVPAFENEPFGQRHYEITPGTNPATATATVTLYFSQQEFTNFNNAPGSLLNLPTGTGDNPGKANLRIGKYPGSSNNGTGLPGSYTATQEVIDPVDANIVFNATFNRWEVTFDVVGFSGFVLQTSPGVLPVNLVSFSAQLISNDVKLKWQTASEIENDHFEIERSFNGKDFSVIGQRAANNGNMTSDYELSDIDAALQGAGKLFYRLKIVSTTGKVEYSKTVIILLDKKGAFVTGILPNPFAEEINVGVNVPRNGIMRVSLVDMTGRVLHRKDIRVVKGFSTQTLDRVGYLAKGIYSLVIDYEGNISTYKVVK